MNTILTMGEWRAELRTRQQQALQIASELDAMYGLNHPNTQAAYRRYDAFTALMRWEHA